MNYFNQEGQLNDEAIALIADAIKLDKLDELPVAIKAHYQSSKTCQQRVIDFASIMMDIDQPQLASHPTFSEETEKPARRHSLFLRLAIAASIALVLFFAFQQLNKADRGPLIVEDPDKELPNKVPNDNLPKKDTPQKNIAKDDTKKNIPTISQGPLPKDKKIETPDNRTLFAANYIPDEEFETMIGTNLRGETVSVLNPKTGIVFSTKETINFEWDKAGNYFITIYNNLGEEKIEENILTTNWSYTQELKPGLYYWKLETEDELLHIDKFEVE